MSDRARQRHPGIHLLGDHLDAALAMGEDLLAEKVILTGHERQLSARGLIRQNRDIGEFLIRVRTLELAMTARLLQARKRAQELKRHDSRLKPLIALFVAGTAPLVDAAAELGDTSTHDFNTGDVASSFLRSRGLIARDAPGLEGLSALAVTEDYLVAARIRLGTLLDLVATFLDTLDLLFDLYADPVSADGSGGVPPDEAGGSKPAETGRIS
jgi:hypothetical protein